MIRETIPRVYAQALLELSEAGGLLEEIQDEARGLAGVLREDETLRVFLETPNVDTAEKIRTFESSLRGRISDLLLDFLLVVIRRGRQLLLQDVFEEFHRLYLEKIGVVVATVITAVPIASSTLEEIRGRVERRLGRKTVLEPVVDPGILGGLVVRCAGLVVDASFERDLRRLRKNLRGLQFGSEMVHEDQP